MVFDSAFQLTRFNAPAARLFDLRPTAIRQHLTCLRLPEMFYDLENIFATILAQGNRVEKIVHHEGRTFNISVNPGNDMTGEVSNLVVTSMDVSEIAKAQVELKQSQTHLNALMENTSILFAMKDLRGEYLYANRRFTEFFHLQNKSYAGRSDFDLMDRELASTMWGGDLKALREGNPIQLESVATINGCAYHLRTNHQVLLDARGNPTVFIIEAEDITKLRQADEQLRLTAQVFEHAGEAIVVTDNQFVIQSVNYAFTGITGYTKNEAIGCQLFEQLQSDQHTESFYSTMLQTLQDGGFWQGELRNKRKSKELYSLWLTINRVNDHHGKIEHYVAVFADISSIRDNERKAEYLATHDTLTKLPNRSLFHDRLRQALLSARRHKQRVALLFIDLDNFKTINDTLGHDFGDELLKEAAIRLREVLRDHDTVARMGGDEFTAILTNCDEKVATQIATRIIDDLAMSYNVMQHQLFVSASVGIAFYPQDSNNSTDLIKAADSAMYRAKESGRNRFEFFKQEMHTRLLQQTAIESGLRNALNQKLFKLVYQPKFNVENPEQLVGAEALLRWQDPDLGQVSPEDFIPIAERSGLIGATTEFVIDTVCTQIAQWQAGGIQVPTIALNISARDLLVAGFSYKLIQSIGHYHLNCEAIQLEITEGSLLDNNATVYDNLAVASEHGIRISIDDFGKGYSSLSYLKRLPLSELKIDKSFVDGLGQDKEDEAITLAIISLAKALELHTVAEGVETPEQLAWLEQQGCDMAQGYLLAKPMPLHEFESVLAKTAPMRSRAMSS
jgi:two-component system CheB/CheR fusion protein